MANQYYHVRYLTTAKIVEETLMTAYTSLLSFFEVAVAATTKIGEENKILSIVEVDMHGKPMHEKFPQTTTQRGMPSPGA